jgi:hypothetical protein
MTPSPLFSALALVLFFFFPGYLLMKSLWPEWRIRGKAGVERGLTMVAGAVVSSTAMTILVGFILGNTASFQAGPGNPILEEVLAVLSVIFLLLGLWRGAYSTTTPQGSPLAEPALQGEDDTEAFVGKIEAMVREELRLKGEIKRARRENPEQAGRLKEELDTRISQRREMEREREAKLNS